ncbi:hypothetical protein ACKAMS_24665 [Rhodococcus sp. 5A-K4]|uniref:hypothetical protein n=1 Tax=Rhodococcus sp. 5A-K4 TaxID=3384442 RepID=UPI0038D37CFF
MNESELLQHLDASIELRCDIPQVAGHECPTIAEFTAEYHDCTNGFKHVLISRRCIEYIVYTANTRMTHCRDCQTDLLGWAAWLRNIRPIKETK